MIESVSLMDLPSALPPPPDTSDPNVLQAFAIVQNGYLAAHGVLNLGRPDPQQLRYHQGRVTSELIPLLDAISTSTPDPAIIPWSYVTAKSLADLYNCLSQREAVAQHRFDSRITVEMYTDSYLAVKKRQLPPFNR